MAHRLLCHSSLSSSLIKKKRRRVEGTRGDAAMGDAVAIGGVPPLLWGSGFRVQGSGFRVQGVGCRV